MSTYLERFKTRRKVNAELVQRYEWTARFDGDKKIKTELANAKRTATSLSKARDSFSYLRPEHKLALDAAASAMRSLISDLSELAFWAKDYAIFCASERAHERVESLEKIAEKRWGGDPLALAFESEILNELRTKEGKCLFGDWHHGLGYNKDVKRESFSTPLDSLSMENGKDSLRVQVAAMLKEFDQSRSYKFESWHGDDHYVFGWKDYDEYFAWRKSIAAVSASAIASYRSDLVKNKV